MVADLSFVGCRLTVVGDRGVGALCKASILEVRIGAIKSILVSDNTRIGKVE